MNNAIKNSGLAALIIFQTLITTPDAIAQRSRLVDRNLPGSRRPLFLYLPELEIQG